MGNQTLVLQSLRRNASGNYYCVATNSEGFTLSNAVRLNVKCKYDYIYIDKTRFMSVGRFILVNEEPMILNTN